MAAKKLQDNALYHVEIITPVRHEKWLFVLGRKYRLKGKIVKSIREHVSVLEKA